MLIKFQKHLNIIIFNNLINHQIFNLIHYILILFILINHNFNYNIFKIIIFF